MIMIIKNSTGPFLANQTKKEEAGPVEFLHFHAYNLVRPIIHYSILQGWTQSRIWTIKENTY